MDTARKMVSWLESHREFGYDLLRIYLGIGLCVRGALFVANPDPLMDYVLDAGDWFWPFAIAHYVALAHLGAGLMLAVGIVTRLAAAVQIPPLIGAVFFVHFGEGLLTAGQSLEFSALVLFMLVVFATFGAGPLSADAYLDKEALRVQRGADGSGALAAERPLEDLKEHPQRG